MPALCAGREGPLPPVNSEPPLGCSTLTRSTWPAMPAKKPASLKRQGRKTAKESATPALVPQPNGKGALLAGGMPGNKGGGRTKDEFKARMRELSSSDEALAYLDQCLRGEHGYKAHTSAMAFAAEHGYGKATETVEVSGQNGGPLEMTVRFVK